MYIINIKKTGGTQEMKVTKGHLTQTEKKAIKAIIEAGFTEAKVGKKTYKISNGEVYKVEIFQMGRGWISCPGSPLRMMKNTVEFTM
jgi:hypothetical protein